jgi:hypothetical protein
VTPAKTLVTTHRRELREIQGQGPRKVCILGTRHCSYLHQQIIELLSYALVLSGNHVYTSGASGTNARRGVRRASEASRLLSPPISQAAAIRGALRANSTDLLTVILPQSLKQQPEDSQDLIKEVVQVVEMPENDALTLDVASKRCNRKLITTVDQLVAFAFHDSNNVVRAADEAKEMDKIVTVMYLD